MTDIYQSSSELVGDLTKDKNILYRGRVQLTTANQGPSSTYAPYYFVTYTKDIEFLNVSALRPRIEVWESAVGAPYTLQRQCPYTQVRAGFDTLQRHVNVELFFAAGSKTTGDSLRLIITVFSRTQNYTAEYFYTITNETIATLDGSLYPSDGSFT